jgi:hypothetical protein
MAQLGGGVLGPLGAVLCRTQHPPSSYDSTCLFTLSAAFRSNPFGLVDKERQGAIVSLAMGHGDNLC